MTKTIDAPNSVNLDTEKTPVTSRNIDRVMESFICTEIVAKDKKNTDTSTAGNDKVVDD
jgi:hypothetical protein